MYTYGVKILFTKHVEDKLKEEESQKLKITKLKIQNVINKPLAVDKKNKSSSKYRGIK